MRKSRRRNKKSRSLLFIIVLPFIFLCVGVLLKEKSGSFFSKVVEGTAAKDRSVVEDGYGLIGKDYTGSNPEHIKSNQDGRSRSGSSGESIDHRRAAENIDGILVLVNKKRYLDPDYKPNDLVIPNIKFSFREKHEKKYMKREAAKALEELFGQAYEKGIHIFALSGYRSYDTQKWIFENKANKTGEKKANELIARPGESEHQTGLAMDLTSQSVQFDLKEEFGDTKEGRWVGNNAHKFGFIIRYPKNKMSITGHGYEPWHIRYVGKKAAKEIYNKDITLEEYLGQ